MKSIFAEKTELSDKLSDALSDGKTYGRKDGSWTEVEGTGAGTATVNSISPDESGNIDLDTDDIPATDDNRYVPAEPEEFPESKFLNGEGDFVTVNQAAGQVKGIVAKYADLPTDEPEGTLYYVYGRPQTTLTEFENGVNYNSLYFNANCPEPSELMADSGPIEATFTKSDGNLIWIYSQPDYEGTDIFALKDVTAYTDENNYSATVYNRIWTAGTYTILGQEQSYPVGWSTNTIVVSGGVVTSDVFSAPVSFTELLAPLLSYTFAVTYSSNSEILANYISPVDSVAMEEDVDYSPLFFNPVPPLPITTIRATFNMTDNSFIAEPATSTNPAFAYLYTPGYEYYAYLFADWTGTLTIANDSHAYKKGWNYVKRHISPTADDFTADIDYSEVPSYIEAKQIASSAALKYVSDYMATHAYVFDGEGAPVTYIFHENKWKIAVNDDDKEDVANKVTSLTAFSTDTQYPSAKAVYDALGEVEPDTSGLLPDSHLTDFTHGDIAHTNRDALDDVSGENTGDQDLSGLLTIDQTTPQTIINGIPLLDSEREITLDNELVDKKYVDDNSGSDVVAPYPAGKNLFNPATITVDKVIGVTGAPGTGTAYSTSDYIRVGNGTQLCISNTGGSGTLRRAIAFYDIDKVYIADSLIVAPNWVNPTTVPYGSYYARISYGENFTGVQLEVGATATTYEEYSATNLIDETKYPRIPKLINPADTDFSDYTKLLSETNASGVNLLDTSKVTAQVLNAGATIAGSSTYYTSSYMRCAKDDYIAVTKGGGTGTLLRAIAFYDQNKTYIANSCAIAPDMLNITKAPAGAKFCRVSYGIASTDVLVALCTVTAVTGTVSNTHTTKIITGRDTKFSSELTAGNYLFINDSPTGVLISTVTDNTNLEVSANMSFSYMDKPCVQVAIPAYAAFTSKDTSVPTALPFKLPNDSVDLRGYTKNAWYGKNMVTNGDSITGDFWYWTEIVGSNLGMRTQQTGIGGATIAERWDNPSDVPTVVNKNAIVKRYTEMGRKLGTVSNSAGSTTLTGVGTYFQYFYRGGEAIIVGDGATREKRIVATTPTSATSLTVTEAFTYDHTAVGNYIDADLAIIFGGTNDWAYEWQPLGNKFRYVHIGTVRGGRVRIYETMSSAQIDNTCEVVVASAADTAMSVAYNTTTGALVITLGTDGSGDPDATKNTATLIATAIDAITDTPFTTEVDNSGDASVLATESETAFGWDTYTFYGGLHVLCEGLLEQYLGKQIVFMTLIKRASNRFKYGSTFQFCAGTVTNSAGSPNVVGTGTYFTRLYEVGDSIILNSLTYTVATITDDTHLTTTTNIADANTDYADYKFNPPRLYKTIDDYNQAIRDVCEYYSIPVIDLARESGLNPEMVNQQLYYFKTGDTTHPDIQGHRKIAKRVIGYLNQLLP